MADSDAVIAAIKKADPDLQGVNWDEDVERLMDSSLVLSKAFDEISPLADIIWFLWHDPVATLRARPAVLWSGITLSTLSSVEDAVRDVGADGYVVVLRVNKDEVWVAYSGPHHGRRLKVWKDGALNRLSPTDPVAAPLFNLGGVEDRAIEGWIDN
jgi:hypothetical protein